MKQKTDLLDAEYSERAAQLREQRHIEAARREEQRRAENVQPIAAPGQHQLEVLRWRTILAKKMRPRRRR